MARLGDGGRVVDSPRGRRRCSEGAVPRVASGIGTSRPWTSSSSNLSRSGKASLAMAHTMSVRLVCSRMWAHFSTGKAGKYMMASAALATAICFSPMHICNPWLSGVSYSSCGVQVDDAVKEPGANRVHPWVEALSIRYFSIVSHLLRCLTVCITLSHNVPLAERWARRDVDGVLASASGNPSSWPSEAAAPADTELWWCSLAGVAAGPREDSEAFGVAPRRVAAWRC